jgi:hypothetical protein
MSQTAFFALAEVAGRVRRRSECALFDHAQVARRKLRALVERLPA